MNFYVLNIFESELIDFVFVLAGVNFSYNMRLLCIAIVLALIQCNCGQEEEEEVTVSEALIDSVFNRDVKPENEIAGGTSSGIPFALGPQTPPGPQSPPPSPLPPVEAPTTKLPSGRPTEDPTLEPKVSNVSRSRAFRVTFSLNKRLIKQI